jgi:hypothetical protein
MSASWTAYVIGPFYVLLPKRWRKGVRYGPERHLARAALISGLGEAVLSLVVLSLWYMLFVGLINNHYAALVLDHANFSATPTEVAGGVGLILVAINPITWVIVYFGLEGILRALAAITTEEVVGTLPLYALEFAWRYAKRRKPTVELPLVPDEITPGGKSCDIQIASCRRREGWKYPFTLRYAGAYFQIIDEQYITVGPRPYIYQLRRLPHGEVARGLQNYDPTDVLTPVYKLQPM